MTQAEEALRQYVPAAAHANHGICLQVRNGIGEISHVIAQEAQTLEVSIEAIQGSAGAAVNIQPRCKSRSGKPRAGRVLGRRHPALAVCLSMIFSENRIPLFRNHALAATSGCTRAAARMERT